VTMCVLVSVYAHPVGGRLTVLAPCTGHPAHSCAAGRRKGAVSSSVVTMEAFVRGNNPCRGRGAPVGAREERGMAPSLFTRKHWRKGSGRAIGPRRRLPHPWAHSRSLRWFGGRNGTTGQRDRNDEDSERNSILSSRCACAETFAVSPVQGWEMSPKPVRCTRSRGWDGRAALRDNLAEGGLDQAWSQRGCSG
jgi:hypothetical protein